MENVGSKSKQNRFTWTLALENVLIELWESNIHNLRKTKHNGHVYKSMVEDIRMSSGTIVTVNEITAKIKNLTRRYREERKKVGSGSPSPWPLYEKVNKILGPLPSHNLIVEESILAPVQEAKPSPSPPINVISSSSVVATEPNTSESEESQPSLSSVPPLQGGNTSRKRNFLYLLLEEFKRANAKAEQLAEEGNELQQTTNNLLQKSLEIQNDILKRL